MLGVRRSDSRSRGDVLLVASSGGHLLQLLCLEKAWDDLPCVWVADDTADTRSLLRGKSAIYVSWPTARSVTGLVRTLLLAWRTLRRVRPAVIVTTGAAVAVPFAWLARFFGVRFVYIESLSRINRASLSCRLVAPFADRLYVQWPELTATLPNARYVGAVISEA